MSRTTQTACPKEQRLVRNDNEIKELQKALAMRFAYSTLALTQNNRDADTRTATSFFGATNN